MAGQPPLPLDCGPEWTAVRGEMKRYEQFAEQIAELIRSRVLAPGERVPSVRQARRSYCVSPSTIFQAYYLLEDRGLIQARARSGYFVRELARQPLAEPGSSAPTATSTEVDVSELVFSVLGSLKDPATVPFGSAFPSPELFPLPRLARSMAHALRDMPGHAVIADMTAGNPDLRRQIGLRYRVAGVSLALDELVITNGAMEALNLCLQTVTQPGDLVAIESPAFYATLQVLERLKLKAVEIPVHPREGIDLGVLAERLANLPIKACWFMSSLQNPMGATLGEAQKAELYALLKRHQVPLIEDDVYAELHFGATPPLCSKALDSDGLVMHVSSFSKCLAPGYRIGWVAAGRYIEPIRRQKLTTSLATSAPIQAALAIYLKQGGYDKHLRQLRRRLAAQEARLIEWVARNFPAGTRLSRPQGGYFLWLELPPGCDALAVHAQALAHGISTAPGPIFSAKREYGHFLRLNFGHPEDPRQEAAIEQLGQLIDAQLADLRNIT